MRPIDAYHRWVEWSDEDQVYIGKCPEISNHRQSRWYEEGP